MPVAAIDGYLRAEVTLAFGRPGCRLTGWGLAGIGRVESNHGRAGRATADAPA